jgi:hypothetical protein
MKMVKKRRIVPGILMTLLAAAAISAVSHGQQAPYVVGSAVTGHVFCADSNAPARFAKVLLKSAAGDHSGEDFMNRLQDNIQKMAAKSGTATPAAQPLDEDKKKAMAAASKGMTQALDMMNASTVGLNGEFKLAGVKPGTYYVHAIYPGYIDSYAQFSDEDFASTDPAIRARIAQIPTVTVTGTDSANAEISLERGAAISGRLIYDDGSPAAGWTLSVIKPGTPDSASEAATAAMNNALAISGAAQISRSDDLGRFRITGLIPGSYALRAFLNAPSIGVTANNIGDGGSGINLAVYSGDTFSRADAKPVTVSAGEEHSGEEITISTHALHSISGRVYSKSDAHTLNAGSVALTSKSNPALHQLAAIRDDGSFHFDYLPGGITYTLTTVSAADGKTTPAATPGFMGINIPNTEILRKYGSDTTDVLLGDADVDSVQLTVAPTDWKPSPKKPGATDVNLGDLMKGIVDAGTADKP